MEQNQNTSLFGLTLDPAAKSHLHDAARWAKLWAIVGFVMCALILAFAIYAATSHSVVTANSRYEGFDNDMQVDRNAVRVGVGIFYTIVAVVSFFPYLFLFQFASKVKSALSSDDQQSLTSSFQSLKKTFRYLSILTIVLLILILLSSLVQLGSRTGMQM